MSAVVCRNHPDAVGPIVPCARCGSTFCNDCVVYLQGRPYCINCKSEHLRDVASGVDATQLPLASIGRRFAAIFLDQLILTVPALVIFIPFTIVAEGAGGSEQAFTCGMLAIFGIYMLFAIAYEPMLLTWYGQTLGKKAMGVRVVRPDGSKISAGQAWGRYGIKAILGAISYITAFFTPEKLCVHDMAAKTRVIRA